MGDKKESAPGGFKPEFVGSEGYDGSLMVLSAEELVAVVENKYGS